MGSRSPLLLRSLVVQGRYNNIYIRLRNAFAFDEEASQMKTTYYLVINGYGIVRLVLLSLCVELVEQWC